MQRQAEKKILFKKWEYILSCNSCKKKEADVRACLLKLYLFFKLSELRSSAEVACTLYLLPKGGWTFFFSTEKGQSKTWEEHIILVLGCVRRPVGASSTPDTLHQSCKEHTQKTTCDVPVVCCVATLHFYKLDAGKIFLLSFYSYWYQSQRSLSISIV